MLTSEEQRIMTRATKCCNCIFDFILSLGKIYVHKEIWTTILQEQLTYERELSNCHNKYAAKDVKQRKTVGHIP